jgi:hypothetical protein
MNYNSKTLCYLSEIRELSVSEIRLPFSHTLPLQLFGFHLVFGYVLHLRL